MKWLSLGAIAFFVAIPRNDASYRGDGAAVYTTKENRVRMVRETIQITWQETADVFRRWHADCDFEFENLSDAPASILMGFPNSYSFGEVDLRAPEFAIQNFTTAIDGVAVATEQKPVLANRQAARWKTFDGAIVWPVHFGPRARIHVQNTYSFGGFASNGPTSALDLEGSKYPNLAKSSRFWSVRRLDGDDIRYDYARVERITYIMTTARTWKGPIGEATISIQLPPNLQANPHFAIPFPRGYRLERNRLVWHFTNYLPSEDIVLCSLVDLPPWEHNTVGFQYAEQALAWTRFSEKSTIAPEVIDRLIANSANPDVKKVLTDARSQRQSDNRSRSGLATRRLSD